MFAAQVSPLPFVRSETSANPFDLIVLNRIISGEAGESGAPLPQRALDLLASGLRAEAARFWFGAPGSQFELLAQSGLRFPNEPAIRPAQHGAPGAARLPVCQVVPIRNIDSVEIREQAHYAGLTALVVMRLALDSHACGQIELLVSQPPTEEALESMLRLRPWLSLVGAHADGRRRNASSQGIAQLLVRASPAALVSYTVDGRVTLWNPSAERLFGWRAQEVLGQPNRSIPPERRAEAEQVHQFVRAGKPLTALDTVRQRPDGLMVPVQIAAYPQFDERGAVVGVLECLSDQSAQRRIARHVQVEGRLAEIMDASESVEQAGPPLLQTLCEAVGWDLGELWLVDAEKDCLVQSATWSRTRAEERAGRQQRREAKRREGLAGRAWDSGKSLYERELQDASSPARGQRPLHDGFAGYALPIASRRQLLGVLVFRDPLMEEPSADIREPLAVIAAGFGQFLRLKQAETERAKSEASLRQSQKMDAVGMLAGGIAHDFNNVLTVILSYSEIASDELEPDHPVHDMLTEIHNAGRRAASMIRRLLTFSRQHDAELQILNLNEMVTDMERMVRRLIGAGIELTLDLEPTLGAIRSDASQIDQLLVNFVVNARDAMPNGGRITIGTRHASLSSAEAHQRPGARPGDFVVLSVRDTGTGMDEATKARIFEPFFTTKGVGKGTGMGLATVASIIQQAGGFIEVDTAPGKGTEMIVHLPRVVEKLATLEVDDRLAPASGGSETVLIVQEDGILRKLLRKLVQLRGYGVVEAATAGEALGLLRSTSSIALVLMSPHLSDATCEVFAAALRQLRSRTQLVVIADSREQYQQLTDAKFHSIHKPFTSLDLARTIRSVLDANGKPPRR